jgi:hypothetical protein
LSPIVSVFVREAAVAIRTHRYLSVIGYVAGGSTVQPFVVEGSVKVWLVKLYVEFPVGLSVGAIELSVLL